MKLALVDFAGKLFRYAVYCHPATVMPGLGVFLSGITQTNDQPGILFPPKHGLEQIGDGSTAVDMGNGTSENGSNIQLLDLGAAAVSANRDGVVHDNFFYGALFDPIKCRAGEHAMCCTSIDLLGTTDFYKGIGGIAKRAGCIDHIIEQNAGLALYITDNIHDFAFIGFLAALIHNGKTHMDLGSECTSTRYRAHIGGNDYEFVVIVLIFGEFVQIVFYKSGVAQQVINGNVEEALDLGCVKVHSKHAVSAGCSDHIGNQLCRNGIAALSLAVLTGIAKVGDNCSNTARRCAAACIDHDEQLHQMVVYGFAGGLDEINITATDGLFQGNGCFAIREGLHYAFAHRQAQFFTDGLSKGRIGVAAKDLDVTIGNHNREPHFSIFFCFPEQAGIFQLYYSITRYENATLENKEIATKKRI